MLSALWTRLLSVIEQIWYQWIAFAMFLENLFPPIPSELIMPFGWFLAGQGSMNLVFVVFRWVVWTYFGVLPFYFLGYLFHKNKLLKRTDRRWGYLWLSVNEIERAFAVFHKRGPSFVFFWRFIPIFRTIISFPAWSTHMHFWWYSLYTLGGSLIWCGLLASIGYLLWDQRELVGGFMKQYEHGILALLVLGLFVFLFRKKLKKFIDILHKK